MRRAAAHAEVLILSELAICGYYPGDLLEDKAFLAAHDATLSRLLATSREYADLITVLGAVRPHQGPGRHYTNALLVIKNGEILAEYHKQLLPTYGIFDEARHFGPGQERMYASSRRNNYRLYGLRGMVGMTRAWITR